MVREYLFTRNLVEAMMYSILLAKFLFMLINLEVIIIISFSPHPIELFHHYFV